MALATADVLHTGGTLLAEAGTGTGKTLAYLIPTIESGSTVVVATATKALQDQLAMKDLPFLAEHLDVDFDFAVLKGRSNYVCLQRLREMHADPRLSVISTLPAASAVAARLADAAGHDIDHPAWVDAYESTARGPA